MRISDDKATNNNISTVNFHDAYSQDEGSSRNLRRPIWNIAHMVNSIKEVDYRLSKGANALEADVTFDVNGVPLTTFHGPPCDCLRHCNQQDNFSDYLKYIRKLVEPGNEQVIGRNLTLLFLDLKLEKLSYFAKVNSGINLARSILTHLYANDTMPIYLVISINHVNDMDLIMNFVHYINLDNNNNNIMKYIGWDIGMNDDIKLIETTWQRFGKTLNLWQGDGFTNCFSPFVNLNRLTTALTIRNSGGYMSKVYQWTIDLHDRMRDALRLNVDGIMTNHPERLLIIIDEPEFNSRFRLANKQDNPFDLISQSYSRRLGDAARYIHQQQSALSPIVQSPSGGFMGGLTDVITSLAIYLRDIPFLAMPSASKLIPKRRRQKEYDLNQDDDNNDPISSNVTMDEWFSRLLLAKERQDGLIEETSEPDISSPSSIENGDNNNASTLLQSILSYLIPSLSAVDIPQSNSNTSVIDIHELELSERIDSTLDLPATNNKINNNNHYHNFSNYL